MSDNASISDLKKQIDALSARLPRKAAHVAPDDVPLDKCNKRALEVSRELRRERMDVVSQAKDAIDRAFVSKFSKKAAGRVQKPLSGAYVHEAKPAK